MSNTTYIRPEEAARIIHVTAGTLRSWAIDGKIRFTRTKGKHRRYELSDVIRLGDADAEPVNDKLVSKRKICYARVSTYGQKKDLETQIEFLKGKFPTHEIIRDLGSGLNFKRKGLLSILESASRGDIEELVITHRDRLCRFGFELFEKLLEYNGGRIVVLNNDTKSPENELVQDLLSIITVFSSRFYGLRSYSLKRQIRHATKNKKAQQAAEGIQDVENEVVSE